MRPLTDEDGEVRELTAEDFRDMRPAAEADPGLIEAMASFRKKMGRPKAETTKIHIGFRLAADVVASVKASGAGYNRRVEQALRKAGFGATAEERAAKKTAKAQHKEMELKAAKARIEEIEATVAAAKRAAPAKKRA